MSKSSPFLLKITNTSNSYRNGNQFYRCVFSSNNNLTSLHLLAQIKITKKNNNTKNLLFYYYDKVKLTKKLMEFSQSRKLK
jgi:hypothetical protein